MQAKIIVSLALAGGMFLTAFAPNDTKLVAAGRAAFERHCTGCHALDHEK